MEEMKTEKKRQCPYCGKMFEKDWESQEYCKPCCVSGKRYLHSECGRTNGWDKRKKAS